MLAITATGRRPSSVASTLGLQISLPFCSAEHLFGICGSACASTSERISLQSSGGLRSTLGAVATEEDRQANARLAAFALVYLETRGVIWGESPVWWLAIVASIKVRATDLQCWPCLQQLERATGLCGVGHSRRQ